MGCSKLLTVVEWRHLCFSVVPLFIYCDKLVPYWPAIPRVPHSHLPNAKAVFEVGGWRVQSPCTQSGPARKRFITCCGGSVLTPPHSPIIPLILLMMSKRTTDRDFSPESHLSNLKDFKIFPGRNPHLCYGTRLYKLWIKLPFTKNKDLLFSISIMTQLQRRCNWPYIFSQIDHE